MAVRAKQADPVAIGERWEDFDHETKFKIAGLDNDEYKVALERARRLVAKADAGQTLQTLAVMSSDMTEYQTQCKLVATYIVKDWSGEVYDEKDNHMDYSPQNAEKLLLGNVNLFMWIVTQAKQVQVDRQAEEAETLGKSSPASTGRATGAGVRRSRRSSTKR